jgi:hypothetical protein
LVDCCLPLLTGFDPSWSSFCCLVFFF